MRLTGRATLAVLEMATDSPPLKHGIHAIDAAAYSMDHIVRCSTNGIYVAPKANMYDACSDLNNKIMFSGKYDILYLERAVTHQVLMALMHKNKYFVVLIDGHFYSYYTSVSKCKFDFGTSDCKNGLYYVCWLLLLETVV